ncbi:MAG: hypothetical protein HY527_00490 [Betaproteobacteria bacterium]|nr:hypothetical protein [Betaproteobacteria bacterium]
MKSGEIKAVEMVRAIRDKHYQLLKGKSPEERRQFYRKRAKALHEELARQKAKKRTA